MIIVALPRSGGTKYCMDLADETGLEFVGEVDQLPVEGLRVHTAFARSKARWGINKLEYTLDEFFDIMKDHSKYIVMSNNGNVLGPHIADRFIFRKNIKNIFLSMADQLLQIPGFIQHEQQLASMLSKIHDDMVVIIHYVYRSPEIIPDWHEDLYGHYEKLTPYLDAKPYRDAIYALADRLTNNQFQLQNKVDEVYKRSHA